MMTQKLAVSPNEFVVRIATSANRDEVMHKLRDLGSVEVLPSYPDLAVLHIKGKAKQQAKKVWHKLQTSFKDTGEVLPVFRDADEAPRYPVGTIMVRFLSPPSEESVNQLADKYGLRARERNKYAPSQFAFESREPANHYLPELLEQMQAQEDLVAVWPETLMAYKR